MNAVLEQDISASLSGAASGMGHEMLSFRTGAEEYAIDIPKVQEIRGFEAPTRIAGAPEALRGVVNLRGVIVPIVDLRLMLGCGQATYDASTVVIILSLTERTVGAVVDSVSDVIELAAEQIKPAPKLDSTVDARFIRGIASVGERMLIVMDIEHMLRDTSLRGDARLLSD